MFSLFLRSQISSLLGQSSAVRNPMFHNLLLSAFPSLINEVPLRNALIAQFSELGGNTKGSLATFSDPQNRDVLNQIKFLHRAVSLLQACFFFVFVVVVYCTSSLYNSAQSNCQYPSFSSTLLLLWLPLPHQARSLCCTYRG